MTYPERVIRLFVAALCALALAFSPAAASNAVAAPSTMPGCTMDGHKPAKPADRSKMDCCTQACQMTAGAALLPQRLADGPRLQSNGALHDLAPEKALASFTATGLDPPPRLPS